MISKFASLKRQLSNAVGDLKPIQSFNVIFFQDNAALAFNDGSLAAGQQRQQAQRVQVPRRRDDDQHVRPDPGPEDRLPAAPQLMYILTDGDFPDNELVLKTIKELNADKKVKINTIAFVNDRDTDTAFITLLETIAKENGGSSGSWPKTSWNDRSARRRQSFGAGCNGTGLLESPRATVILSAAKDLSFLARGT